MKDSDGVWFGVAARDNEILATWFSKTREETYRGLTGCIKKDGAFQVADVPSAVAAETVAAIKQVYDGEGTEKTFPFAYSLLPFYSERVSKATLLVPVGYVTTYAALAEAAGGGPRAVGNVMASNRFWPIVPCHRVVKSDWTLGGYGGGLKTKVEMLRRENRGYTKPTHVSTEEGSLAVYPVDFVLKKLPAVFFG